MYLWINFMRQLNEQFHRNRGFFFFVIRKESLQIANIRRGLYIHTYKNKNKTKPTILPPAPKKTQNFHNTPSPDNHEISLLEKKRNNNNDKKSLFGNE